MLTKTDIRKRLDEYDFVVYDTCEDVVAIGSRQECAKKLNVSERQIVHSATKGGLRVFEEGRSPYISVAVYMPELEKEMNLVGN
ncbi:hypothetical protein [Nosocomiicoccus ampullae]|uniref:hypothetical protein n=1 Tax=Nosocomiicoccus ampullae TaxID=489910 RepID=UPI001C5D9B60|nr:hypothetical protein [Nosocomiicoccus ampullae]QYA48008.1 hypothetical protein KPF52_06015 [Nosocomiicoccus ampullae]